MPYTVPTLQEWLKQTYALAKPRSPQLKAVDDAIAAYHKAPSATTKIAIQKALKIWQDKEPGKNWVNSARNKSGAVSELDAYVNPRGMTTPEKAALNVFQQMQQENFKKLFTGARFQPRGDKIAEQSGEAGDMVVDIVDGICGDIAQNAGYGAFKQGLSAVAAPVDTLNGFVIELLSKCSGGMPIDEVVTACGMGPLVGLYSSVAPFFGPIKTGLTGAKDCILAAADKVHSYQTSVARSIVIPGAADAALQSVSELLDRRAVDRAWKGAIQLAEGSINAALTATGYGAAATAGTSLASKAAVLVVIIRRRVLEYKECKAGDKQLAQPDKLTLDIFKDCPLLGAYLVAQSDHSSIVVSALSRGMLPRGDWKLEVERHMKRIHPIIDNSKEFIGDYMWELEGGGFKKAQGQVMRAQATDQRPFTERLWIERFGATQGYYRLNNFNQKLEKFKTLNGYADYVKDPIRSAFKKATEEFVAKLRSAKSAAA